MLFEIYYVGFGQAIASFSPNELLASILVPVFCEFYLFYVLPLPSSLDPSRLFGLEVFTPRRENDVIHNLKL